MTTPENAEDIKKQVKAHWILGGILFILVSASVAIAQIHFVTWAHVLIGLAISFIMAALVLWYFMHMNQGNKLIYQIMAFSFLFFLFLVALTLLAFYDPAGYHIIH
jgi:caa(3)-type oxidase subunit IV